MLLIMSDPQLHASIVALVSLASGIAAKHPDMGMCQLDRLRTMGISEAHIKTVIEIARHIRDEAAQKLDVAFDEKLNQSDQEEIKESAVCCTPTASGQSCC